MAGTLNIKDGWLVVGAIQKPGGAGQLLPALWDVRSGKVTTHGHRNSGASASNRTNRYSRSGSFNHPHPLVWWPSAEQPDELSVLDPAPIS